MTKAALYKEIQVIHGQDASYVANVVLCWHKKPARKLRGLLNLLTAGNTVKLVEFDVLTVNGQKVSFAVLDTCAGQRKV